MTCFVFLSGMTFPAAPALAGFIGISEPTVGLYKFQHELSVDFTQRDLNSSRWTPEVTLYNTRFLARETYGLFRFRGAVVNLSLVFGISKSEIDFGTVDMNDGGVFWDTYAPGTTNPPGSSRRQLSFGQEFGSSFGGSLRTRLFKFKGKEFSGGLQVLYSSSADAGLPAMRLQYAEWDAFLGALWKRSYFSFYGGLDASWLIGQLSLPDRATDLEQRNLIGVYGGMKISLYRHIDVVSELRLLNQLSLSAQLVYHF